MSPLNLTNKQSCVADKWMTAAVCSAVSLAATNQSEAVVVATPGISLLNPLIIPNNIDGVYLNVVNGLNGGTPPTGWDINPYSANVGNLNWWGPTTATWLSPSGAVTSNISIPVGHVVDSTDTYIRPGGGTNATAGGGLGQFTLNAVNYVGFQFLNENTTSTHYGYLAIELGASFAERSILGSYYEDQPGVGIQVTPIPEPATAFLAAGAMGVLALRRRRNVA